MNQKTRTYLSVEKSQSLVTIALSIRLTVLTSLYNINKYKLIIDLRLEFFFFNLTCIIETHKTTFNLTQHAFRFIYQINFKPSKDSRSTGYDRITWFYFIYEIHKLK